jgi:tryptophanyl-tRNA synthetase
MPKPIVTPWEVKGNIDYNKLIKEFGTQPIDAKLLKRIKKHTGELHHFLRRGIFFSHRDMDKILDAYEKGHKVYLYTGRAPSGPVHLGHLVPWMFTLWLQKIFKCTLLFQIPDEEKFLFKDNLTLEDSGKWAEENILDIIALGFDPKQTKIFRDTEYAVTMYKHACRVGKKVTFNTAKSVFGFTNSTNLAAIFYTCMQSVPAFLPSIYEKKPTMCLIPYAIDQDPHFRVTRDVAKGLGYPKPAGIHCRFLPGLQGLQNQGKMSSSEAVSAIYTTETPKEVRKKIMKYAFSGGRDTLEEHRKLGGNPEVDIAYQWLTFFEEDDKKLAKIHKDYKSGKLLSGEIKQILIDKINGFLAVHQKKREKAKNKVEKFMLRD